MNDEIQKPDVQQMIAALNNPQIENVYFNGFANAVGNGDVVVTLFRNGQPIKVLNTSFTVAKTLAQKLNEIVSDIEARTKVSFLTTEDVQKALQPK